ncbi:hypothetical protein HMI54_007494 [Coelomomyces lativittatus]|nr:hypothetical protein HMI54_007494 [Coelomomyces lativittatus]
MSNEKDTSLLEDKKKIVEVLNGEDTKMQIKDNATLEVPEKLSAARNENLKSVDEVVTEEILNAVPSSEEQREYVEGNSAETVKSQIENSLITGAIDEVEKYLETSEMESKLEVADTGHVLSTESMTKINASEIQSQCNTVKNDEIKDAIPVTLLNAVIKMENHEDDNVPHEAKSDDELMKLEGLSPNHEEIISDISTNKIIPNEHAILQIRDRRLSSETENKSTSDELAEKGSKEVPISEIGELKLKESDIIEEKRNVEVEEENGFSSTNSSVYDNISKEDNFETTTESSERKESEAEDEANGKFPTDTISSEEENGGDLTFETKSSVDVPIKENCQKNIDSEHSEIIETSSRDLTTQATAEASTSEEISEDVALERNNVDEDNSTKKPEIEEKIEETSENIALQKEENEESTSEDKEEDKQVTGEMLENNKTLYDEIDQKPASEIELNKVGIESNKVNMEEKFETLPIQETSNDATVQESTSDAESEKDIASERIEVNTLETKCSIDNKTIHEESRNNVTSEIISEENTLENEEGIKEETVDGLSKENNDELLAQNPNNSEDIDAVPALKEVLEVDAIENSKDYSERETVKNSQTEEIEETSTFNSFNKETVQETCSDTLTSESIHETENNNESNTIRINEIEETSEKTLEAPISINETQEDSKSIVIADAEESKTFEDDKKIVEEVEEKNETNETTGIQVTSQEENQETDLESIINENASKTCENFNESSNELNFESTSESTGALSIERKKSSVDITEDASSEKVLIVETTTDNDVMEEKISESTTNNIFSHEEEGEEKLLENISKRDVSMKNNDDENETIENVQTTETIAKTFEDTPTHENSFEEPNSEILERSEANDEEKSEMTADFTNSCDKDTIDNNLVITSKEMISELIEESSELPSMANTSFDDNGEEVISKSTSEINQEERNEDDKVDIGEISSLLQTECFEVQTTSKLPDEIKNDSGVKELASLDETDVATDTLNINLSDEPMKDESSDLKSTCRVVITETKTSPLEQNPKVMQKRYSETIVRIKPISPQSTLNKEILVDLLSKELKLTQNLQLENVRRGMEQTLNNSAITNVTVPLDSKDSINSISDSVDFSSALKMDDAVENNFQYSLNNVLSDMDLDEALKTRTEEDNNHDPSSLQLTTVPLSEESVGEHNSIYFSKPQLSFSNLIRCIVRHSIYHMSLNQYLKKKNIIASTFIIALLILLTPFLLIAKLCFRIPAKNIQSCSSCGWTSNKLHSDKTLSKEREEETNTDFQKA